MNWSRRFQDPIPMPDGRIINASIPSPTLGKPFEYRIYLPPGYNIQQFATTRYPVIYLLHGAPGGKNDWVDGGFANQTADALIKTSTIRPVIIVMPDGSLGDPHHDTQWGNSPVTGERVSLSGYFNAQQTYDKKDLWGSDQARAANSPANNVRPLAQPFHIDLIEGLDEGQGVDNTKAFDAQLTTAGIDHQSQYFPGAHTWDFWKDHLLDALEYCNGHLTSSGADQMTDFLVEPVAQMLQSKATP